MDGNGKKPSASEDERFPRRIPSRLSGSSILYAGNGGAFLVRFTPPE
jgi:hypothetical protein